MSNYRLAPCSQGLCVADKWSQTGNGRGKRTRTYSFGTPCGFGWGTAQFKKHRFRPCSNCVRKEGVPGESGLGARTPAGQAGRLLAGERPGMSRAPSVGGSVPKAGDSLCWGAGTGRGKWKNTRGGE